MRLFFSRNNLTIYPVTKFISTTAFHDTSLSASNTLVPPFTLAYMISSFILSIRVWFLFVFSPNEQGAFPGKRCEASGFAMPPYERLYNVFTL